MQLHAAEKEAKKNSPDFQNFLRPNLVVQLSAGEKDSLVFFAKFMKFTDKAKNQGAPNQDSTFIAPINYSPNKITVSAHINQGKLY